MHKPLFIIFHDADSDTRVIINLMKIKGVFDNDDYRTVEYDDGSTTDITETIDEIFTEMNKVRF